MNLDPRSMIAMAGFMSAIMAIVLLIRPAGLFGKEK